MKTEQVALVVSCVSAGLSLVTIGWNIHAFGRSGPRVTVALAMGSVDREQVEGGTATVSLTVPTRTWTAIAKIRERANQTAYLTATNSGRAAVWINSIGFWSQEGSSSANVSLNDGEKDLGFGPSLPFKLDAGQTMQWAIPLDFAKTLIREPVPGTHCVHGELVLGTGQILRTKDGVRVDLVREVLGAD